MGGAAPARDAAAVAMNWARRLKRVFEIEGCARCGGKLRILAHLDRAAADQHQPEWLPEARAPPLQLSLI